ncbi:ankyrin repeat domain-containing protein [Maribacter sp. MMG018]|uniref:ankyrin repeat domain-containing protein n=1 Tax=Maribacter sp. MMG018 TaxID=2822688 RepID=UPI001B36EE8B|nr:ankyrin repeat domain-containing protein [Maribacter sp. MMG018]MBQ4916121.1 ankyrin repeat domain-containing protein [Maribacter sp. MMG018]
MKKSILMLSLICVFTCVGTYANTVSFANAEITTVSLKDKINELCKASMQGDVDQVRSLIALGEKVNEKSLGLTPAMYAARYNKSEVLKVLILNGANLDIKSDKGHTAKEYAEMSNAKDVLEVINANF